MRQAADPVPELSQLMQIFVVGFVEIEFHCLEGFLFAAQFLTEQREQMMKLAPVVRHVFVAALHRVADVINQLLQLVEGALTIVAKIILEDVLKFH